MSLVYWQNARYHRLAVHYILEPAVWRSVEYPNYCLMPGELISQYECDQGQGKYVHMLKKCQL